MERIEEIKSLVKTLLLTLNGSEAEQSLEKDIREITELFKDVRDIYDILKDIKRDLDKKQSRKIFGLDLTDY